MIRFQPTILEDWVTTSIEAPRPLPTVTGKLTTAQIAQYQAANLELAPLRVPEVEQFRTVLRNTMLFNQHRSLGGRRLVVVNGPSHIGKTTAVIAEGITRAHAAGIKKDPNGRVHPIPWVYAQATASGRGRVLARSISDFLGLPLAGRDTAYDIVNRVAALSRAIGIEVIVIDDFHFMRPQGKSDRSDLANILKHLISAVPATFVIAGVAMQLHPLVKHSKDSALPGDQIFNRANWVTFKPWPMGTENADRAWERLVGALRGTLSFPRGAEQWQLDRKSSLTLIQKGSGQRPATAIEWITLAANHAIEEDRPLTAKSLRAITRHARSLA